ncbi:MAG: PUA domain-containing protein [Promethearchaeota archaeon]
MSLQQIFREINKTEKEIISEELSKLDITLKDIITNDKIACVSIKKKSTQKEYPKIYIISKELKNTCDNFIQDIIKISAGLYFGYIKENSFYLSLEGAEYLFKQEKFPKSHLVFVNKEGEKSVLYGNNLFKRDIIDINNTIRQKDLILILNADREVLALGYLEIGMKDFEIQRPNKRVIKNLVDKGYFLRKE